MKDLITQYFSADEIKRHIKTITFKKGEMVMRPHDETNNIYAIINGLAKVYNVDVRKSEYISVIYGPGDFYPLAWLIDQSRPPIYFQAMTDCQMHVVPRKIFQRHINENIELSNSFTHRVVEQFAYYASTVNNLGLKYGRERLCYKLLVLGSKFGVDDDGTVVIPHISHSDLGATINMTRETVNKEISKLEKLGVLEYNRKNIVLKDMNYLHKEIGENVPVAFFDSI
jgi:CRP-like cAMP-binding protein